jgi:hypothetical protein
VRRFRDVPVTQESDSRSSIYQETEAGNPRWALPDAIATSKLDAYRWQDEYRLVFSLTNALSFENVNLRIVVGSASRVASPAEHHKHDVHASNPKDIAILHGGLSAQLTAASQPPF